jgi:hypothetical protein
MSKLLELPSGLAFLLICIVTVSVAIIGLRIVRKKYHHEELQENHEVAAVIFNAFGLLYAVVVAFVVFVVWSRYDEAAKNLELEANESIDLFYTAKMFPDSINKPMREALYQYASSINEEEFEMMTHGEKSQKTSDALKTVSNIFINMDISKIANVPGYMESFKRFNDLAQYRRIRLFAGKNSVPSVIWVVLLIGAIITVAYTYFFGIKNVLPQNLMTAALTITITVILFLIFILEHPYMGNTAVNKEPMTSVAESMKKALNK